MKDGALSLEALLLARSYLYEMFHKALGGDPDSRLIEALTSDEAFDAMDEYVDVGETMSKLRTFLGSLADRTGDARSRERFAEQAKAEYTRMFVGPDTLAAQPCETPYATHEMVLFSENTVAVRRMFVAYGFEPRRVGHVPDDHVSLMCDFMARMAVRALGEMRKGDRSALRSTAAAQGAFAASHMANWLSEFARLQSRANAPVLYPQLSAALAEFVRIDVGFLAEVVAWADGPSSEEAGDPAIDARKPESFARLEFALDRLRSIDLKGLEDCELREFAAL